MNTAPYGWTKAGDAVDVRRSGFQVDIDSDYVPLCGSLECNQGRGKPCGNNCAEVKSAQAEGARMADVSRPVPLEHDRSTQYRSSRAADRVMLALAVGTAAGWLLAKVFA